MNKKIIALLAASTISVLTACEKDTESLQTQQQQTMNQYKENLKEEQLEEVETLTPEIKEEEKVSYEIFEFYLNHTALGKYVKSVEQRDDVIVVDFHNSYKDFKVAQPFNISYNENTFPNLYKSYVKEGDFSLLNSYLITRTTYVLANYPQINRVIVNIPPDTNGKYYVADVKREELNLVLGFDVSSLKKSPEDTNWGDNFTNNFANEYMYKISDEPYDSNKRFLNKFIQFKSSSTRVENKLTAKIQEYQLPVGERPTMERMIKDSINDNPYSSYFVDDFTVIEEKIELSLSNKIEKEKGATETKKALVYVSGRLLAEFPELQSVNITAGSYALHVERAELTKLLGYDISLLINVEGEQIGDLKEWSSKFLNVYTAGAKLDTYINTFTR